VETAKIYALENKGDYSEGAIDAVQDEQPKSTWNKILDVVFACPAHSGGLKTREIRN